MAELQVHAPDGVPEVQPGDDLATLLLAALPMLADGDVVAVTSKVVSKAEGRQRHGDREGAILEETSRVIARRGATVIVRTHHGLTMAAAGVDTSNVPLGQVLLLPEDPDGSARALRRAVAERTGRNVAVVVTDTAGRAWREGQTDIAVGAAGLQVLEEYAGRYDEHGNELAVTAPAVADELAGVAELASGKLGGRPFAMLRGRADLVLPTGQDGPGAAALARPEGMDLFGYGAREAVLHAVLGEPEDRGPFGAPAPAEELLAAVQRLVPAATERPDGGVGVPVRAAATRARVEVLAFAHGWRLADSATDVGEDVLLLRPTP